MQVAHGHQKATYDHGAKNLNYRIGDSHGTHGTRIHGEAAKLAHPFFGPFQVLSVTPSNAEVRLVDRPDKRSIFVSLSQVRECYDEFPTYRGVGMLLKGNDVQTKKFVKCLYKLLTRHIPVR